MKNINAILITGILTTLVYLNGFCQELSHAKPLTLEPHPLAITYSKTTHLIFPYSINSVDRGSKDILAQKAKGVENVLQVKAARKGFDETNLTVITGDGKFYSYVINYSDNPSPLNIQFIDSGDKVREVFFSSATPNEAELIRIAKMVSMKEKNLFKKKDNQYGIQLQLKGIYIQGDNLYFQIGLKNKTTLNYTIDQLRFFIKDKKKAKRTATQEQEVKSLFVHNNTNTIEGKSEEVLVFVLPKFTVPDKKHLSIQMMEKNGGRHLKLIVGNNTIMQSKALNNPK